MVPFRFRIRKQSPRPSTRWPGTSFSGKVYFSGQPSVGAGAFAFGTQVCYDGKVKSPACSQSWEDLTPAEQEEVRQAYEDIRSEWTSAFSGGGPEDRFARDILRQVDQLLR